MSKLTRSLAVIAAPLVAITPALVATSVVLAFRGRTNIVLDAAGETCPDAVGAPAAAA